MKAIGQSPTLPNNGVLLMNPVVQKELHMSPNEANKAFLALSQSCQKMGPELQRMMSVRPQTPESIKKAQALYDQVQNSLLTGLTPAQRVRFQEINLQSFGARALLDPRISAQVGLSKVQIKRLDTTLYPTQSLSASDKPRNGVTRTRPQENVQDQTNSVIRSILTADQLSKWKAMLGKPVDFKGFGGPPNNSVR